MKPSALLLPGFHAARFATASLFALSLFAAMPAQAEEGKDAFKHVPYEEWQKMTPEQKRERIDQRKAEWQKLSKEDKLNVVEERRAAWKNYMDQRWSQMSDDEKLAFAEKKMNQVERRHSPHHGLEDGRPGVDAAKGDVPLPHGHAGHDAPTPPAPAQ